jgi:ABC-2 type transport system permease protein
MQAGIAEESKFQAVSDLPKSISAWGMLKATVIKDLRIARRYRQGLITGIIYSAARLLFFVFFSNAISINASELGREMTSSDLFIFFQGSLVLWIFIGIATGTPLRAVGNDLYNGTLEYLYTNPCPRYAYYVGSILSDVILTQITFLPLYLILAFFSKAGIENMVMVLLVCVTVFITLTALGVMIAGLELLWRNVGAVVGLLHLVFETLAGAFFPISAFPPVLQYMAYLLPFTWGYDLVRYYSFDRSWNTILPVWQEWIVIIVSAIIFTVLSRYLLKQVEGLAKREGLNLI